MVISQELLAWSRQSCKGQLKEQEEDSERSGKTTGLEFGESLRAVENRDGWRNLVETSSVVSQRPSGTDIRGPSHCQHQTRRSSVLTNSPI